MPRYTIRSRFLVTKEGEPTQGTSTVLPLTELSILDEREAIHSPLTYVKSPYFIGYVIASNRGNTFVSLYSCRTSTLFLRDAETEKEEPIRKLNSPFLLSRISIEVNGEYVMNFSEEEKEAILFEKKNELKFLEGSVVEKKFLNMIESQVESEALWKLALEKKTEYDQLFKETPNHDALLEIIDTAAKSAILTIDSSRLFELGELLEEAGEIDEAKIIYKQFLDEFPEWMYGQEKMDYGDSEMRKWVLNDAENMYKIASNKITG
jgi:hypothetical protein